MLLTFQFIFVLIIYSYGCFIAELKESQTNVLDLLDRKKLIWDTKELEDSLWRISSVYLLSFGSIWLILILLIFLTYFLLSSDNSDDLCFFFSLRLLLYISSYILFRYTYLSRDSWKTLTSLLKFKWDNIKNMFFYDYFILYRFIFALLVVWIYSMPDRQWFLICVLNLAYLKYTFKSFKSCLQNFLHIYNWIMQFTLSVCLILFLSPDDPYKLKIWGYVSAYHHKFILKVSFKLSIFQ